MHKTSKRGPVPKSRPPKNGKKVVELISRYLGLETANARTLQQSARFALSQKVNVIEDGMSRKVTYLEAIITKNLADSANDRRKLDFVLQIANGHQPMGIDDPILEILARIKNRTYSRSINDLRELMKEIIKPIDGDGESDDC